MMKNFFAIVTLLILVIASLGSSTDTIADLSQSCQTTLVNIMSSKEFFDCIPPTVLPLFPFLGDSDFFNRLITNPRSVFLTLQGYLIEFSLDITVAPKCSDDGVAKTLNSILEGCQDDIETLFIKEMITLIALYSPIRDSLCFNNAVSYPCLAQEDFNTFMGLPNYPIVIGNGEFLDSLAVTEPENICTPCNKAIFNTFNNFINENGSSDKIPPEFKSLIKLGFAVKCGIEFEDGIVEDPSIPH